MPAMQYWWLWVLGAYVCGATPFGLWIGLMRGVDIRKAGSGNTGATNAARLLGVKWGVLCLLLDVAKGATPVVAAGWAMGVLGSADLPPADAWRWLAVGAAAVVGHVFSFWLKFKGGKGVATSLGVLMGFWPILTVPGLAALATWLLFFLTFRYVSLASIVAAVGLPLYLLIGTDLRGRPPTDTLPFLAIAGLLALLVVVRHRTNMVRLWRGTE